MSDIDHLLTPTPGPFLLTMGVYFLVIAAIGYDPERDAENPTGSVFCEHGAGVYVPWNEVKARAHVPCVLQERPVEAAEPMPARSRASYHSSPEVWVSRWRRVI